MSAFKRNLLIGFGLSLILLIVSAAASYISIRNLLYNQQMVTRTNDVISELENIISVLKDAETGQRGYLLTGQANFLDPYNGASQKIFNSIQEVTSLVEDDPTQLQSITNLASVANRRNEHLRDLIQIKREGGVVPLEDFVEGKQLMDSARMLINLMEKREQKKLASRTETLNRFASSTPTLIIVASLLAILVTIIFFFRVNKDYSHRTELQRELLEKEKETTARLTLIRSIAEKISSGDYKTRVSDAGQDVLGNLSVSLNRMAESLDNSFSDLSEKEWFQTGIAELNELMIGEKNLSDLSYKVVNYISAYTKSPAGAFYLAESFDKLQLTASVGIDQSRQNSSVNIGDGIVGHAARNKETIYIDGLNDSDLTIDYTGGSFKPQTILAAPIIYDRKLKGVIELGKNSPFSDVEKEFFKTATFNIGLAIHSARDHQRLQELLAETQAQSEELQSQQGELENMNAELEAQAEKLQASEEELRVQQEELQQSNQELEERSRLLEEKNELILERNLDIQRKAEELELSTKYKSEFLANMSHELRTPLNSILLLSRLLSENHESNLNKDQVEYATVIQNSGNGLLTLIDEILDLSKIEAGKMDLQKTDVSIRSITEELQALFAPIAHDKGINFKINIIEPIPGIIETDKLRVSQILRNLIANALKFTKAGSVTLDISRQNNKVLLAVKDTGIGIPKDKHLTIFEAFQQADGSTRRQFGGTGLGLSISRELAKLLGGEITLKSEEGKGSEFTLVLPLTSAKTVVPEPAVTMNTLSAEAAEPEEPILTYSENGNRYLSDVIPNPVPDDRNRITDKDKVILIIEDDTAFARSLLDYTRQQGYKGVVAVRGDEGIQLAKQYLPVGILLDVQLPIKSGWEVMDELKSDPETRPIPVHMMSSYEVKNRSLTKGAVDFINKPVAFDQLGDMFKRIEEALSRFPKKVLIVEENNKHAQALALFLDNFSVHAEIKGNVDESIEALTAHEVDCVILDMGIPTQHSYDTLEQVKKTPGFENLPIIIFTGKNLSHVEEMKIKQYADSIVIKTAHSYQRILDEVSLFLHLVEEHKKNGKPTRYKKLGEISEVLKGKTVLVADDDVRNIFSLTKSLENYGINVISAIDGKEALKQLEDNKNVDIVLMDMMMPEMDGYESTARIRSMPKYKNLPIIAVTAKAMTGDREKCINAGASDYITKPVDVDQLISLLRVWLYA